LVIQLPLVRLLVSSFGPAVSGLVDSAGISPSTHPNNHFFVGGGFFLAQGKTLLRCCDSLTHVGSSGQPTGSD